MRADELENNLLPTLTNAKSFGFFISGGFDSAVLLYVCCAIKQEYNLDCEFKIFTVPRHDDSVVHAQRVIDWISKKFNMTFDIEFVGNPNLYHSHQVLSGLWAAKNSCDHLVLGDTNNPSKLLTGGPFRQKSNNKKFLQPYIECNWDKNDTVALAIELTLTDLMEITHTCTESKTLRCTTCWQCRERAWAFAENNYTDPGTM